MEITLSDWSMYQSNFIGDPNSAADKYNPNKWVVDLNFEAIAASGIAGIIIRTSIILTKDPCFDRYRAGLERVGLPWGIYHAFDPDRSVQAQIDFMRSVCGHTPPLGVFVDVERGNTTFAGLNGFLLGVDAAYGRVAGLYSANWYLAPHFTLSEQSQWLHRPAWFAGYPNLVVPAGWQHQAREYTLHQFTDNGTLAGMPRRTLLDRLHPTLTLDHLLNGLPAPTRPRGGGGPQRRRTPAPPPPPPAPPTQGQALFGLHGRADGRLQPPDLQVVQSARIEAVKLMSTAAPEDVDRLRSIAEHMPIMVRCFVDFRNRTVTPQQFADAMSGDLAPFVAKGIKLFEVHNEPNLVDEGLGTPGQGGSWPNGAAFGEWFTQTVALLSARFPEALWGWPGLSPGDTRPCQRADATEFLRQAGRAPAGADWIGVHAYWQNEAELDAALADIGRLAGQFPGQKLYVTEFANVKQQPNEDPAVIAQQYLRFVAQLRRLPVAAAFAFVVSASFPGFAFECWRDEQGRLSVIPSLVGARPALPPVGRAPAPTGRWWEAWPEGVQTPPRRLASPPAPVQMFKRDGQPLSPPVFRQNAMDVFERQGDLLRVLPQAINGRLWWVRAADVQPE